MLRTNEEWNKWCYRKGTSGDMVYDILQDWRESEEVLKNALQDWLDCADTPEEWMRCRNQAKIALGRIASPAEAGERPGI